ncbi:hypothetical protein HY633_02460 [Candidatus Uhrbacteria bacterium]|nr:hypothetical protein [Candidatus Uhrbacteria bacterium]
MEFPQHNRRKRDQAAASDRAGFSLMETLTVIGVMSVVMMMVGQIFTAGYDVYAKQTARTENESGAVVAGKAIADLSRGASEIVASSTVDGTSYTTSDEVLVLKMPAIDGSNNIVVASYDYVAFARSPTDATKILVHTQAAAGSKRRTGSRLVTAYNDVLKFRYNRADPALAGRVQVYIVNRQTKRATAVTTKSWTAIFLRNR